MPDSEQTGLPHGLSSPSEFLAGQPAAGAAPAQSKSDFWASSPDHDPRVTAAILAHPAGCLCPPCARPDAAPAGPQISAVRAQVTEEFRERALERQRREAEYYGRDRPPAPMGASADELGRPVQRSVVRNDVPELGSER